MSIETNNDSVNEYLSKPPHWLVGNGIALIFMLIVVFSVISMFVEINRSDDLFLSLESEETSLPIHIEDHYFLSQIVAASGDSVTKGTPVLKVVRLPSEKELMAFKSRLASNLSANREEFNELFDKENPVSEKLISAEINGIFIYDEITSRAFVLPHQMVFRASFKIDRQANHSFKDGHNLMLRLTDGESLTARVNSSGESLQIEFIMPRSLTAEEIQSRRLVASLISKQSLWASLIEKL
ncbi:hypothetical protein [Roseivirga sp. E12]|uniref:hypothetical protein n=1 Tax=Roseivirga sp. E12 TaxID=2819237 RepID=UPI001ABC6FE3|nr:hypothetical protein [Roseivirga sp. E12]MBO3699672.1 hypothetical protein [Roseivirga sp. E12]